MSEPLRSVTTRSRSTSAAPSPVFLHLIPLSMTSALTDHDVDFETHYRAVGGPEKLRILMLVSSMDTSQHLTENISAFQNKNMRQYSMRPDHEIREPRPELTEGLRQSEDENENCDRLRSHERPSLSLPARMPSRHDNVRFVAKSGQGSVQSVLSRPHFPLLHNYPISYRMAMSSAQYHNVDLESQRESDASVLHPSGTSSTSIILFCFFFL